MTTKFSGRKGHPLAAIVLSATLGCSLATSQGSGHSIRTDGYSLVLETDEGKGTEGLLVKGGRRLWSRTFEFDVVRHKVGAEGAVAVYGYEGGVRAPRRLRFELLSVEGELLAKACYAPKESGVDYHDVFVGGPTGLELVVSSEMKVCHFARTPVGMRGEGPIWASFSLVDGRELAPLKLEEPFEVGVHEALNWRSVHAIPGADLLLVAWRYDLYPEGAEESGHYEGLCFSLVDRGGGRFWAYDSRFELTRTRKDHSGHRGSSFHPKVCVDTSIQVGQLAFAVRCGGEEIASFRVVELPGPEKYRVEKVDGQAGGGR